MVTSLVADGPTGDFIAGGTGYVGSHLIPLLIRRGHAVRALVRKGSKKTSALQHTGSGQRPG